MLQIWNEQLFLTLHGLLETHPWLVGWVSFATEPITKIQAAALDSVAIAAVFLVLFIYYDGEPGFFRVDRYTWRKIAVISLTGIIAWTIAAIAKDIFLVPRPYMTLAIEPLFRLGTLDSFPSGHATFFAAVSVAVYHYHRNLGALFVLATVLIGLARIIAGVHYPFDILAGFILGGGGAILMVRLLAPWQRKNKIRN